MTKKKTPITDLVCDHIMLDVETLGDRSDAAIVGIGAVKFNLNSGKTSDTFYERIDISSALEYGTVSAPTLKWWLQQDEDARKGIYEDARSLTNVLYELYEFILSVGLDDVKMWGNSARFDLGILANAFYKCGYNGLPWAYYNERDVRTLVSFDIQRKFDTKFQGVKHTPLDDCFHQIKYCVAIWNSLKTPASNIEVDYPKTNLEFTDRYGNPILDGEFYLKKDDKTFTLTREGNSILWKNKVLTIEEAIDILPKESIYKTL